MQSKTIATEKTSSPMATTIEPKSSLKIQTTVTETKTVEKEIELPYFFAGNAGYDYYKIISAEVSIAVFLFIGNRVSIELRNSVTHFMDADSIEISEFSFNAAYNDALSKIQNQNL